MSDDADDIDPEGWDGLPPNPNQDGVHLLRTKSGMLMAKLWSAKNVLWFNGMFTTRPKELVSFGRSYVCELLPESSQSDAMVRLQGHFERILP